MTVKRSARTRWWSAPSFSDRRCAGAKSVSGAEVTDHKPPLAKVSTGVHRSPVARWLPPDAPTEASGRAKGCLPSGSWWAYRPSACRGSWVAFQGGDRGDAMVVWCLFMALLLLPLAGLSVDLWHGIAAQRQLQSAADEAAAAGASGINVALYREDGCIALDPALATSLAQANLASQVGLGPLSQVNIGVSPEGSQITVMVSEDVHLTLLSLAEQSPLVVRAVATSKPEGSGPAEACRQGA